MNGKKHRIAWAVSLALGVGLLAGCNSSDLTGNSGADGETLLGSVVKGPIDNATIQVLDAAGRVLASGASRNGVFEIGQLPVGDAAVFIRSGGGRYTDEATGQPVELGPQQGLMTVFTADELRELMRNGQYVAMTPETTLVARIAQEKMNAGTAPAQAIREAIEVVKNELLSGTSPVPGAAGDEPLRVGNLAKPIPSDQKEALARNRAASFAFEAQRLGLSPTQTLDLVEKRAEDLTDGKLDGKAQGNPLRLRDKDGKEIDLSAVDQRTSFGMARSQLLNRTMERLQQGELSEAERDELRQMGFDTDALDRLRQRNADAEARTQAHLQADDLPAFQRLPVLADEDGDPANHAGTYTLTATPGVNVTIQAPGSQWITPMLRYNGEQLPPVIRASRGDAMTLKLVNDLAEETTIHWHGFEVPGDQDGGPDRPVAPGTEKTYQFTLVQPAASLWFHPHPDMKTGKQVYMGLAGVFLLDDDISRQLEADKKLPAGDNDIPVLVQDRRFKEEQNGVRELAYLENEMDRDGMLGDQVLVNGAVLPKLEVGTRKVRLRLYNVSNARTYDFALHDGGRFWVVGTDGGLLPQPVETDHIRLGAAERAEIVIDFGRYQVGDRVMLISRAFAGGAMAGMMGGMGSGGMGSGGMGSGGMGSGGMGSGGMGSGGMGSGDMGSGDMGSGDMGGTMSPMDRDEMARNGLRMDIMRFDVVRAETDDVTLYDALPQSAEIVSQRLTEADAGKTRHFVMSMQMGGMGGGAGGMGSGGMGNMTFVINGKTFDMNRIDEVIKLSEGDTEIWSIENMSPMAHPFHAHAIQWQVLDRNGQPASGTDLGWKDTVLVQPGETVRIIGRFDPAVNSGDYMYHCHILEHEDAGMMGFFRIQP